MEYNVGDKVRVRQDLRHGQRYQPDGCTESIDEWAGISVTYEMETRAGKIVTISDKYPHIYGGCYYYIREDFNSWKWADKMFYPVDVRSPSFELLI